MWSIPKDVLQRVVESLLWFFLCWICSKLIPGLVFYQSPIPLAVWLAHIATWKARFGVRLQLDVTLLCDAASASGAYVKTKPARFPSARHLTAAAGRAFQIWAEPQFHVRVLFDSRRVFPASSAARWGSSVNQETSLFGFCIWLTHI